MFCSKRNQDSEKPEHHHYRAAPAGRSWRKPHSHEEPAQPEQKKGKETYSSVVALGYSSSPHNFDPPRLFYFKFFVFFLKKLLQKNPTFYYTKFQTLAKQRKVKAKVAQLCDSLQSHPWDSPGQNPRMGSLSLLQGIFPNQGLNPSRENSIIN